LFHGNLLKMVDVDGEREDTTLKTLPMNESCSVRL
jgi:hypothetical protein